MSANSCRTKIIFLLGESFVPANDISSLAKE